MMPSLVIILLICICAGAQFSQCGEKNDVSDWDNHDYAAKIRDQGSTGMCWAFATVAFLETSYAILTRNKYTLSPEQIGDNLIRYLQDDSSCIVTIRPTFHGMANLSCSLAYVQRAGIMTEYHYPFTSGGEKNNIYNRDYITPIGVRNITNYLTEEMGIGFALSIAITLLRISPVIVSICATQNGIELDIDETCMPDHAVMLVKLCVIGDQLFAQYQNSWGGGWGSGGYGYILVGNTTSTQYFNNRRIFGNMITADVYDLFEDGYTNHWDTTKIDEMLTGLMIAALCATIILAIIIGVGIIIYHINKYHNMHHGPIELPENH